VCAQANVYLFHARTYERVIHSIKHVQTTIYPPFQVSANASNMLCYSVI